MTSINNRYALEPNGENSFHIVDLFTQKQVGDFWYSCECWVFQLNSGESRFGGYVKVLKSLKLMLRVNKP